MDAEDFRRIALSLEGAEEHSHMGAPDFRVGGRIFATLASQDKGYGNLMLTPEQQAVFVEELPEALVPNRWRLGKQGSDPYQARPGDRGPSGWRAAHGMEATARKEVEVAPKKSAPRLRISGERRIAVGRDDEAWRSTILCGNEGKFLPSAETISPEKSRAGARNIV